MTAYSCWRAVTGETREAMTAGMRAMVEPCALGENRLRSDCSHQPTKEVGQVVGGYVYMGLRSLTSRKSHSVSEIC